MKIIISKYKNKFRTKKSYYENNWLEGYLEINNKKFFEFDLLQAEELEQLKKWIDKFEDSEELISDFVFADSTIQISIETANNKKNIRIKYYKFIKDKIEILAELNKENAKELANDLTVLIQKFPIR